LGDQDNIDDQDQLSQELLLSGVAVDNRLDWLLGAFYMDEEGVSDIVLRLSFKDAPSGFGSSRHNEYSNQSYAAFAQGTYRLGDRLSVVGGVRYSVDDKEDTVLNVNLKSGIPNLPTTTRDDSWDVVTYRVGLEYKLSDNVLSYGSYATGYKVGGWNGRSSSLNQFDSYAEEEVSTIEIGFKGDLLDRKLRLNFSGYYSDYTDIQTTVNATDPLTGNVFNVVQNAAAADIYGMELEALAHFGEFWQVNLGVSWMDAEYSELDPGVLLNIAHELPQIPEWTLTTGIQYARPFSSTSINDGEFFFRADYSFKDDFHHNAQNSNFTLEPSYEILNLRAGFGPSDGRWQLAAYAKNVFDEEYMQFREDVFAFLVAPAIVAPPREVGVEMSFNW
jgi:iron complex outermembrane receptor protein